MKKEYVAAIATIAAAAVLASLVAFAVKLDNTPTTTQAAEVPARPTEEVRQGPRQWYSPNVNFSACILSTKGPAGRIEELEGGPNQTNVQEFKNIAGNLYKVEVSKIDLSGDEHVWTYYLSQEACVAEKVQDTQALANKYR
ncbi:hypothetical protein [Ralstonia pseudosolanacearum]|uniref:hypothetical protein n=1 Tax=Ralstonia pseudosolanacearum TaxID=1310165 RepID=UPI00267694B4|nr:hypothetical protein [Ralstonia pseudosolanacearum]MDO3549717.1 hypothetical protein [Ralstonia pseudosolanacearum]MDO3584386.1 hypothetical protein [Ralstonia pseudosolanacearum]